MTKPAFQKKLMSLPDHWLKIILYFFSKGITDALLALRGIILASFLGPEAFGGWVLFRLATNYCAFAHFGVHNGLEFEVARSKDQPGKLQGVYYWRSALGFVLLVFGIIASITLSASFFVEDRAMVLGMRWFSGAILCEQVWLLGLSYLRAIGNLRVYAIGEVTNASLQFIFASVLAPVWGLSGAFAGFVLAMAVSLIFLVRRLVKTPALSFVHLHKMLKVGFPILVSLLIGFILASADRLVVASHKDIALLGWYGFAFSIAGIAGSLAWVIRVVIFPEVYARVATDGVGPALAVHLKEIVLPFARIIPPVIGLMALLMGPVIEAVLPQYTNAIPAARILIFIGATAGFERLGTLGVVAAERQRYLPYFSGGGLILNVSLSFLALRCGIGLQGVAAAAVFSNAMFGITTLALLASLANGTRPAPYLLKVVFPLLWCTLSVFFVANFLAEPGVYRFLASVGIYLVTIIPLVPGALSEIRKVQDQSTRSLLRYG